MQALAARGVAAARVLATPPHAASARRDAPPPPRRTPRPSRLAATRRGAAQSGAGKEAPQRRVPLGPEPPPDWMSSMAAGDEGMEELLRSAASESSPEMRSQAASEVRARAEALVSTPKGSKKRMRVKFRDVNQFSLWVWAELNPKASTEDKEVLAEVFKAWYVLGKLGAFNDSRLQVAEYAIETVHAISNMPYRVATKAEEPCYFHAMGDCEFKGNWMRCWFDMGTADEMALDMLINSLDTFSMEYCGIVQLVIGGLNEDWKEGTDEMEQLGLAPIDRLLAGAPVPGWDDGDVEEEARMAAAEGRREQQGRG